MRKRNKHLWKQAVNPKAELKEGLLELGFWLAVCAVAGGGVILFSVLFPDASVSGELSMYIAMGGVTLTAFAVIWFFVKRKERKGVFSSFSELCKEIQKAAPDWVPTKDGLRVTYRGTALEISESSVSKRCTCTLIREDGTKRVQSFTYDETHRVALEFLHDQCIGVQATEITDDGITGIRDHYLFYTDDFGREHEIDLALCAENFARAQAQAHPQSSACVGERNAVDFSFVLHTAPLPAVIIFNQKRLTNRKKYRLIGGRYARFNELNRMLNTLGYTTFDLS